MLYTINRKPGELNNNHGSANNKFYQKKLIVIKNVKINGLYDGKNFVNTFDLSRLINCENKTHVNIIDIGKEFDIQISQYSPNTIDVLMSRSFNKKRFNIQLKNSYEKIINGGFLIFNSSNLKISPIEINGRLMYYGFESKINLSYADLIFTIAQKLYKPSLIESPSTRHILALDRVGIFGKNIKIHKIRSMFPYSELLHKNVMDNNSLSSIGKVNTDPRITPFGEFIRKYWIDELPQIYDWLRGEIKLVGIRALSYPFFQKYPDRYKTKYLAVKPGLICPIFDVTVDGFEEIVKIEEKYLDDYLNNPVTTDLKLFFRTLAMIFRGTRSI